MDGTDDSDKKKSKSKLLILPGGKKINADELGMGNSIVGSSGNIPTSEVIDPSDTDRELREREAYVKRQELVQAATKRNAIGEMVELTIQEITEELAHLKFERRKAASEGKPTVQHTIARISMLRNLADVLLKKQENNRQERMDFRSPEFKKVIHEWLGFVCDSMSKAGLGENDVDLVLKQMEADMADWEKRLLETAV